MIQLIIALLLAGQLQLQPTASGVDLHLSLTWQPPRTCTLDLGKYREVEAVVVGTVRLNVRQLPSASSTILGSIGNGDTIHYMPSVPGQEVPGRGSEWYPIMTDHTGRGYVHTSYLDVGDFTWSC